MWDVIVSIPDDCLSVYFVSSQINDKHDDFHFDINNFPFIDSDVPHSTSYSC